MQYNKPPLTFLKQVDLLISRGLSIPDKSDAAAFLSQVSYYRLSAYFIPFEYERHVFWSDATFDRIRRLYVLDSAIRTALFEAIRELEIYFRTQITYQISIHDGAFAHYNTSFFRTGFDHAQWIKEVEDETTRSHEVFVTHYRKRYDEYPKLPLWMTTEIMSMGKLSQFYNWLLPDYQRLLSKPLGIHHSVLRSWLHTLTYLRNLCAHHARIWNRELAIRPELPRKDPAWQSINNTRLYAAVIMMEWLMIKAVLPVEPIMAVYSSMDNLRKAEPILAKGMGVPDGWQGECRWKTVR